MSQEDRREPQRHKDTEAKSWLERQSDALIVLLLVLISFAAFGNSLGNGFVYDDHILIEKNLELRNPDYLASVFNRSFSQDLPWINSSNVPIEYYRPFTRLLFGLAFQAFGLKVFYWHLLNLFIYCGVVVLGFVVLRQLSQSRAVAAIGTLLFALHPIHSESVAWVNCLVETLHALFFLAAFALYLHSDKEVDRRSGRVFLLGSMTLLLAALLSKETALCFPILVGIYSLISHGEAGIARKILRASWTAAPFLIVVGIYFALRYVAYGSLLRVGGVLSLATVFMTIPGIVLEYIRLFAIPVGLNLVHNVPLVSSPTSLSFWLPLLLLVAVAVLVWTRGSRMLAFVSAWIVVTMLPALNIGAFTPELMMQSRYVFLPSLGFCAVVALAFVRLLESEKIVPFARQALMVLLLLVAAGLFALTVRQNSFWHSDLTLFARAAERNPGSEIAQCYYAWSLYDVGKVEDAAQHFTLGFKSKNGESTCGCMGLARYYSDRGNYDQAIVFYNRAIELGEGNANLFVFSNLAFVYSRKGESGKAIELLQKVLSAYPDFQNGYYTLGGILLDAGRMDDGIKHLHHALELNPQDAGARLLLGQAFEGRGLRKEAAEQYRLALSIAPDLEPARTRLNDLER